MVYYDCNKMRFLNKNINHQFLILPIIYILPTCKITVLYFQPWLGYATAICLGCPICNLAIIFAISVISQWCFTTNDLEACRSPKLFEIQQPYSLQIIFNRAKSYTRSSLTRYSFKKLQNKKVLINYAIKIIL